MKTVRASVAAIFLLLSPLNAGTHIHFGFDSFIPLVIVPSPAVKGCNDPLKFAHLSR